MTVHQLHSTDTLSYLAARYLGNAARWREIARANNLRPPYISAEPLDQYGPSLTTYMLVAPVSVGQQTLTITSGDSTLLRRGTRLALTRTTLEGVLVLDVIELDTFGSGAVTLTSGLLNDYPANTPLRVYAPAGELRGIVARPGDMLLIPGSGDETASSTAVDDRYGRDMACDDAGRLLFTASGDVNLVDGSVNLVQQLRHRLRTERGLMTRHPTYGCEAQSYIGRVSGRTLEALLQGAIAAALSDDPRVSAVLDTSVVFSVDSVEVAARVSARNEVVDLGLEIRS